MLGRIALLDASVLYSAPLRDLLMQVALAGLFRAKWSEEIHTEWIEALLRRRSDLRRAVLERTRELMNRAILDALVSGYEGAADAVAGELPDAGDVHIVAAAIKSEADTIVTFNLKHFPETALAPHGLQALHPDAFLTELLTDAPEQIVQAIRTQRLRLKNPAKSAVQYLETLKEQKLNDFVAMLISLNLEI